jgi:SAM-dependent methyltransferase
VAVVGRTLAVAVYRPLAEQLLGVAAPAAGERVLELSAGDGEVSRLLAGAASGPLPTVVVATDALASALREAIVPLLADAVVAPAWHVPFGDGDFDLAVSLLAIAGADRIAQTLAELARVARRVAILVWTDGATHENALRDAWRELGAPGEPPDTMLTAATPPGWSGSELADVARFDGIGQLWAGLVTERSVAVPAAMATALQERLAENVAAFTAADGTLRIPVRATLLTRDGS